MKVEYCVIGNGLLGASIAYELSKSTQNICLIGARYGEMDRYFSSHEDDSRMVRQFHGDAYWENLTARNRIELAALMEISPVPIFHPMPVLYRFPGAQSISSALLKPWHASETQHFTQEDSYGGFLNPLGYIQALNQAAKHNGVRQFQGIVQQIKQRPQHIDLATTHGNISANYIIDARGIHGPAIQNVSVVAKVVLVAETSWTKKINPFCFIDADTKNPLFQDIYGFYQYQHHDNLALSKFGFSESHPPFFLHTEDDICRWFLGGYLNHPCIAPAKKWAVEFLGKKEEPIFKVKPCAFTITPNGRPLMIMDKRWLTISGCNGKAAKCCQALAQDAVAYLKKEIL